MSDPTLASCARYIADVVLGERDQLRSRPLGKQLEASLRRSGRFPQDRCCPSRRRSVRDIAARGRFEGETEPQLPPRRSSPESAACQPERGLRTASDLPASDSDRIESPQSAVKKVNVVAAHEVSRSDFQRNWPVESCVIWEALSGLQFRPAGPCLYHAYEMNPSPACRCTASLVDGELRASHPEPSSQPSRARPLG